MEIQAETRPSARCSRPTVAEPAPLPRLRQVEAGEARFRPAMLAVLLVSLGRTAFRHSPRKARVRPRSAAQVYMEIGTAGVAGPAMRLQVALAEIRYLAAQVAAQVVTQPQVAMGERPSSAGMVEQAQQVQRRPLLASSRAAAVAALKIPGQHQARAEKAVAA